MRKVTIVPALIAIVALMGISLTSQAQTAATANTGSVLVAQITPQAQHADRMQATVQQLEAEANSNSPRAERAAFELFVMRETQGGGYLTMADRQALMQRYQADRSRSMNAPK